MHPAGSASLPEVPVAAGRCRADAPAPIRLTIDHAPAMTGGDRDRAVRKFPCGKINLEKAFGGRTSAGRMRKGVADRIPCVFLQSPKKKRLKRFSHARDNSARISFWSLSRD